MEHIPDCLCADKLALLFCALVFFTLPLTVREPPVAAPRSSSSAPEHPLLKHFSDTSPRPAPASHRTAPASDVSRPTGANGTGQCFTNRRPVVTNRFCKLVSDRNSHKYCCPRASEDSLSEFTMEMWGSLQVARSRPLHYLLLARRDNSCVGLTRRKRVDSYLDPFFAASRAAFSWARAPASMSCIP